MSDTQIDHERLAGQTAYDLWVAIRHLGKLQCDVHDLYDEFHTSDDYEEMTRKELANDLRAVENLLDSAATRIENPVRDDIDVDSDTER